MVKAISIHFEDEDYKNLKKIKADLTWRDLILTLIPKKISKKEIEGENKKTINIQEDLAGMFDGWGAI